MHRCGFCGQLDQVADAQRRSRHRIPCLSGSRSEACEEERTLPGTASAHSTLRCVPSQCTPFASRRIFYLIFLYLLLTTAVLAAAYFKTSLIGGDDLLLTMQEYAIAKVRRLQPSPGRFIGHGSGRPAPPTPRRPSRHLLDWLPPSALADVVPF